MDWLLWLLSPDVMRGLVVMGIIVGLLTFRDNTKTRLEALEKEMVEMRSYLRGLAGAPPREKPKGQVYRLGEGP